MKNVNIYAKRIISLLIILAMFVSSFAALVSCTPEGGEKDTSKTDNATTENEETSKGEDSSNGETESQNDETVTEDGNKDESDTTESESETTEKESETVTETETETETETVDVDEKLKDLEGIVISKVYGPGSNTDAAIGCGFIELYNTTTHPVVMDGASLFYGNEGSYNRYDFRDVVMNSHSYYLIKCADVKGYDESFAVMKVEEFDSQWAVEIDNKEFEVILSTNKYKPEKDKVLYSDTNVVSYVRASQIQNVDIYTVDDVSKNKVIVRTELQPDIGYHKVNLVKSGTAEMTKITPKTSKGDVNKYVASKFKEVLFSVEGGVYEKDFTLKLTPPEGYTIYYTTDGSNPKENGVKYNGGISIKNTNDLAWGNTINKAISMFGGAMSPSASKMFGGTVIKAYAKNGTEETAIYTNTYFVSAELAKVGVTIMSMSINVEDFCGAKNGAYYTYQNDIWGVRPRSLFFMEVFDTEGNKRGGSYAEFAVSGNGSSGWAQKSLRLYYKDPTDLNDPAPDSLEYNLFEGYSKNILGQTISTFDRILIRNSGNDYSQTLLRDAFCQRMARNLNCDSMAYTPSLVFINGEFWGLYNCRERYSPEYFENHYGVLKENVTIVENESPLKYGGVPESWNNDYVSSTDHPEMAKELNDLIAYIKTHDLKDEACYKYVTDRIDVDSIIDYWIAESIYYNNDWPGNNIKVWRNMDPNDPSGMDTKWRFLVLDLDHCLGYAGVNSVASNRLADSINQGTRCGAVMYGLMQNPAFKKQFGTRAYEVVKTIYTAEEATEMLQLMADRIRNLIPYEYERFGNGGAPSPSTFQSQVDLMMNYASQKPSYFVGQITSVTGLTEAQLAGGMAKRITVEYDTSKLSLKINGKEISNGKVVYDFKEGNYALDIVATAKPGYIVYAIVFIDIDGKMTRVDGDKATFVTDKTGNVILYVRPEGTVVEQVEPQITTGRLSVFYLNENGDLFAWGDNTGSALGLGVSGAVVNMPTLVMGGVSKVATSHGLDEAANAMNTYSTAVLSLDGILYTVGENSSMQLGRTGDPTKLLPVSFKNAIVDVAMGLDHMVILDEYGDLWGIGNNRYGQLGSANYNSVATEFQKIASNVVKISAGRRNTAFIDNKGSLYVLGDNRWNKFHTGDMNDMKTPYLLENNVKDLECGTHEMIYITNDGKLYYRGWRRFDSFAQTDSQADMPNGVPYLVSDSVKDASIYDTHIVLVKQDGSVYGYGFNEYGQISGQVGVSCLGQGNLRKITSNGIQVSAGNGFTAVLKSDGNIYIWGRNDKGCAGAGTQNAETCVGIKANFIK